MLVSYLDIHQRDNIYEKAEGGEGGSSVDADNGSVTGRAGKTSGGGHLRWFFFFRLLLPDTRVISRIRGQNVWLKAEKFVGSWEPGSLLIYQGWLSGQI